MAKETAQNIPKSKDKRRRKAPPLVFWFWNSKMANY